MLALKLWTKLDRADICGFNYDDGSFFSLDGEMVKQKLREINLPVLSLFSPLAVVKGLFGHYGLLGCCGFRLRGQFSSQVGLTVRHRYLVWVEVFEMSAAQRLLWETMWSELGGTELLRTEQPTSMSSQEWKAVKDTIDYHRLHAPIVLHPDDLRSLTI